MAARVVAAESMTPLKRVASKPKGQLKSPTLISPASPKTVRGKMLETWRYRFGTGHEQTSEHAFAEAGSMSAKCQ